MRVAMRKDDRTVKASRVHLNGARHSIPRSVYDRVHQAALDIVNASACADVAAGQNAYRRLRRFCLQESSDLTAKAFLLESLADFTQTPTVAIKHYRAALRAASSANSQQFTIFLALGESYLRAGARRQARRCFTAALENARKWRNREAIGQSMARINKLQETA